jgi:putative membrane protein
MNIRLATLGSAAALILSLGSVHAADENTDSSQLPDAEKSFLEAAAATDKSEIELSKVALAKSRTPAVKSFAQQMITEHNNNYRDLQALCDKKSFLIAPELDSGHRAILRKLQSGSGDESFDHAYIDAIVSDHAQMDTALDQIANNSNDADLKQFAADTLLVFQKHEQMAKDLSGK